jgi:hypothetical protein
LIVILLQPLAWAVKVDDAARARINRNSGVRNFMCLQIFATEFKLRMLESRD